MEGGEPVGTATGQHRGYQEDRQQFSHRALRLQEAEQYQRIDPEAFVSIALKEKE